MYVFEWCENDALKESTFLWDLMNVHLCKDYDRKRNSCNSKAAIEYKSEFLNFFRGFCFAISILTSFYCFVFTQRLSIQPSLEEAENLKLFLLASVFRLMFWKTWYFFSFLETDEKTYQVKPVLVFNGHKLQNRILY